MSKLRVHKPLKKRISPTALKRRDERILRRAARNRIRDAKRAGIIIPSAGEVRLLT